MLSANWATSATNGLGTSPVTAQESHGLRWYTPPDGMSTFACLSYPYLVTAGGGWRAVAKLDAANGFPHSNRFKRLTQAPYDGSVPHFTGTADTLRGQMTMCRSILMMGTDPVKLWQPAPGTTSGQVYYTSVPQPCD